MADFLKKNIIALGFFDCVHAAHRKILAAARETAEKTGGISAAITFDTNIKSMPVVYDYEERTKLLGELCDKVISFEFSEEFRSTRAADFLEMLLARYNAAGFVCGYDYTFGRNAEGDSKLIAQFARDRLLPCVVTEKYCIDGEPVSSTRIRNLLLSGDVKTAGKLLVKPYHVRQKVMHGRGQGHLFGFPTINFMPKTGIILPKTGVYSTMSDINGKLYKSVTNIGDKPTFGDKTISIETFVDGFSGDLYGAEVTVYFYKRIRDVIKFQSPEQLKKQIYDDIGR